MPEKERKQRKHTPSARRQVQAEIQAFLQPRAPISGDTRRRNAQRERQLFLIVCEGERTEPLYFRGFRVQNPPIGLGRCTVSLVEEAIRLRDKEEKDYYDQCWVVFDKDSFPAEDFHEAIRIAEANGFRAAYTNEAFELWYLLHFELHKTAYHRDQYKEKLDDRLNFPYAKNDPKIYKALLSRQEEAIRNAKLLLGYYEPHNPAKDNPSTTVHYLVEELRRNSPH